MAAPHPLASIPTGVSLSLHFAPGIADPAQDTSSSKKRKRSAKEVIGLRYNFKPASITPDTPGTVYTSNGSRQLKFDLAAGGQQVFDAREEAGKSRECVMIWDEATNSFTLHPLYSTLHLTLNRSASTTAGSLSAPTQASPRRTSVASSSSSTSIPLAASAVGTTTDTNPPKRSRPSEPTGAAAAPAPAVTSANRPVRAGKSLPRKQPASAAPTTSAAKGRSKAGARKSVPISAPAPAASKSKINAKAKAPATPSKGKIKSAAIIEDSDEEAAAYDEEMAAEAGAETEAGPEVEEDEFAMLLGQSLADGADDDADADADADAEGEDEEDEDDEEEDEEDDDEALGGAKVVLTGDGSEWL